MTSVRRPYVASTSVWRHFDVISPIGLSNFMLADGECAASVDARGVLWNASQPGRIEHMSCPDGYTGAFINLNMTLLSLQAHDVVMMSYFFDANSLPGRFPDRNMTYRVKLKLMRP